MIIIDPIQTSNKQGWSKFCHLFSTLHGDGAVEELLEFGKIIGLKKEWLQNQKWDGGMPHFDLKGVMIQKAINAGATQVDKYIVGALFFYRCLQHKRIDSEK